MASTYFPRSSNYYTPNAYGGGTKVKPNVDLTETDPRKITQGDRQTIYQQGQQLSAQDQALANQYSGQAQQTQDYLGNIESPLAQGKGGYNASELSQIQMTPEQQQQIVTGAGISAGTGTAASVGAAQRAAAAAGGNPAAMAAYRARAAQQEGAQAGDAMTQARVAASNAAAQRAQSIGQARMGQQAQGLGYYGGLQAQQAQEAEAARGRQEQSYGTETGGLNQGAQTAEQASQNPTGFDKFMGAASGVASAFLEEGGVSPGTSPAVVGENGPEKVVRLPTADYMQDGDVVMDPLAGVTPSLSGTPSAPPAYQPGVNAPNVPWWSKVGMALKNVPAQPTGQPQQSRPWNPVDTYTNMGKAIGGGLSKLAGAGFLADGGIATGDIPKMLRNPTPGFGQMPTAPQGTNGIFTKPTRVNLSPGEAAVPLNYRAGAKVRPSFAALPAARPMNHPFRARV